MLSKRLLTLLSLVLVANLMLAACEPERATPSPAAQIPTPTAEVASTPLIEPASGTVVATQVAAIAPKFKHPDTYTTFAEDPQTLDPAWAYGDSEERPLTNIYEGMVRYSKDRSDEFVPVLSTGRDVNPAGDVWTFHVRQGVTFHAGGTLEPHDVAYSMQRALLQDRGGGAQWMTLEALFGLYTIEDLAIETAGVDSFEQVPPEALIATCERVKAAVSADDAAGTVTYRLGRPTPWFLSMLSWSFVGAVVDMEWMVEQGAWDGDCATWVAYHDPPVEDTVLFDQSNGTGPYKLDHWTSGEELVLLANQNYWRPEGDPMWEGGPSGLPRIKRVVWKIGGFDWDTRLALFQAGDVDTIGIPSSELARFEPFYKTLCHADGHCEQVNPDGTIQAWRDLPALNQVAAMFNWQINVAGGNPFIGSGQLDGGGIPPDFFQDLHVRRAFNTCFDFDTLIADLLDGQGIQAQGPIIAGMMGYREGEAPLYAYDPARCEEEFKQAFDGVLWEQGFYLQLPYNTDNDGSRLTYELLKAGVEAVNPGFVIEVIDVDWPVLDNHRRAGQLPIFVGSWYQDFHDPHNWVHAFLHSEGYLGDDINMPEELAAEYDTLIEWAASLTTVEERRPLYEQLQLKAQQDAVAIWLYQPFAYHHLQTWIKGYYYSAAVPVDYIYAFSKEAP
jgi:peptide/nickel transport system substrate-binding protein